MQVLLLASHSVFVCERPWGMTAVSPESLSQLRWSLRARQICIWALPKFISCESWASCITLLVTSFLTWKLEIMMVFCLRGRVREINGKVYRLWSTCAGHHYHQVVEVLSKAFKRFKDVKRAETGGLGKKYVLMTSISSQWQGRDSNPRVMAEPTTQDTGQRRSTAVYKHTHLVPEENPASHARVRLYSGAAGPGAVGGRLCN